MIVIFAMIEQMIETIAIAVFQTTKQVYPFDKKLWRANPFSDGNTDNSNIN